MHARLLHAHQKRSLLEGNIVDGFLEQIMAVGGISCLQAPKDGKKLKKVIKGKTYFFSEGRSYQFDFSTARKLVLDPNSPCNKKLSRKSFNKFPLYILEEDPSNSVDPLFAPLDPKNTQTGICVNVGMVPSNKNSLFKGWQHQKRASVLAVVPANGQNLLEHVENRTCYLGPRPYALVKFNLAKGRLYESFNRDKSLRSSLTDDFRVCAKFLIEALNELIAIEKTPM